MTGGGEETEVEFMKGSRINIPAIRTL